MLGFTYYLHRHPTLETISGREMTAPVASGSSPTPRSRKMNGRWVSPRRSSRIRKLYVFVWIRTDLSCFISRANEIGTGTPWRAVFSVLGGRMFDESTKRQPRFSGSGSRKRRLWCTPGSATMDMKCWLDGKSGGDSVCSVCGSLWATISMSAGRVHRGKCYGMPRRSLRRKGFISVLERSCLSLSWVDQAS